MPSASYTCTSVSVGVTVLHKVVILKCFLKKLLLLFCTKEQPYFFIVTVYVDVIYRHTQSHLNVDNINYRAVTR